MVRTAICCDNSANLTRVRMVEQGALIVGNNSGHNVLALTEKAPQDLVALATLYYTAQVAGQARGTEEAERRDISRFLGFYYDPIRHYPPRHGVNPTS